MTRGTLAGILALGLSLGLVPDLIRQAHAAEPFADGATVRVLSNSIEPGWFTGKIRRNQDRCWMVHLDTPTKDHYTMLSLLVIDELQVANAAQWVPVAVTPVLQATPASCREYGAD
ncbi:MAG TPA: hypothetical protein VGN07_04630 [Steroidobacteraceae bacterium]|jgi:hypothetical protein